MTSQLFKKPLPYLALLIAHVIWGANFVVAKVTLQEFPPMSLAFLRFSLASLFLAPFFLAQSKKIKIKKEDLPKLVAQGILIVTLNIAFFFEGIKRTTATDASVLILTVPILSVLLGWWFLKEKIYLVNLFGIILGLLGSLVIVGLPQILIGNLSIERLLGNILIILTSISWVAGAIIAKPLLTKYSSLVITAIAFMVGTVTFFIPASLEYLQNPSWVNQISILGILGVIYMTLLSSISAYFLFEWGLSKTSVYNADLFNYIEPFIATGLAVVVLGERISQSFLIGGVLIAAGAYLGTLAKNNLHHSHKAHRV